MSEPLSDLDVRGPATPAQAGDATGGAPQPDHTSDRDPPPGLTTSEFEARFRQYGLNKVDETRRRPLQTFARKFWAPVPWMLEATVVLELLAHKRTEAVIIAGLLVFNAVLSFAQESQANGALRVLRSHLAVQARVFRDRRWLVVPAEQLVPGDAVHLRMGDIAPADIRLFDGTVQVDESELTGESQPVDKSIDATIYAGSRLTHGEADGEVRATGSRTYFGKTAELVKTAKAASHLESLVFDIVKYLVLLDSVLVAALLLYAGHSHLPWSDVLPFALILLVASVPVALPATFTVATALGALDMSRHAVLVTRLSAIEDAAAMDVLCTDKTGTITQNRLSLAHVCPIAPHSADDVLRAAALASDPATQDPIDLTILEAAKDKNLLTNAPKRVQSVPFDPATKRSEAIYERPGGRLRVIKGAPHAVLQGSPAENPIADTVERLASRGARVLAVAAGTDAAVEVIGLLGLEDPIRQDSKTLVSNLKTLGVRVIMVTGDGVPTARAVSDQVGIGDRIGSAADLRDGALGAAQRYDVIAGVFPEDKFRLVQALQNEGHIVGMTGDGVNDAPALKQAETGIAVSTATDVAKAAASIVLTESGLSGIVRAVETGRRIYQRMLTYTLNKIAKTVEIGIFLSLGVMLTGTFVVTPLLVVLLLFTNDFVTMSIATDRVSFSPGPDRWNVRTLILTAGALAGLVLILSFTVFFVCRDVLHMPLPQLQTVVFLMLVFTGQGNVYLLRERRRFWNSRPSTWLIVSSVADVVAVSVLATRGILMASIPWSLVDSLLGLIVVYLLVIDGAKVNIFRRFGVR